MRPTVIVCTTSAVLADTYKVMFEPECRRRGLRLLICPGAGGEKSPCGEFRAYGDVEELFDYLGTLDIETLAHLQVWMDLSSFTRVWHAFSCTGREKGERAIGPTWYRQENKAWGPATRLVLQFPLVFPVFMHPGGADCFRYTFDWNKSKKESSTESGNADELSNTELQMPAVAIGPNLEPNALSTKNISATFLEMFQYDQFHFVNPLSNVSDDFFKPLMHFSNGHRCYFDPVGLRTILKAVMLGESIGCVRGNKIEPSEDSEAPIKLLLGRLKRDCVVVEDELSSALLNAYIAWRKGYRAWLVTTFASLEDVDLGHRRPTCEQSAPPKAATKLERIILRDRDLRFPDLRQHPGRRDELKKIKKWEKGGKRYWRTGENSDDVVTKIVTISSYPENTGDPSSDCGELNKNSKTIIKPIHYLHQLIIDGTLIFHSSMDDSAKDTVISQLEALPFTEHGKEENKENGHGAPYYNLFIAEHLIAQSRKPQNSTFCSLLAALLTQEAYELLLGMGQSTALEALAMLHIREVEAEVGSIGVANIIEVAPRAEEIEKTLKQLFPDECGKCSRAKQEFLLRIWGHIRRIFRDTEHFEAAEDANRLVITYSNWLKDNCASERKACKLKQNIKKRLDAFFKYKKEPFNCFQSLFIFIVLSLFIITPLVLCRIGINSLTIYMPIAILCVLSITLLHFATMLYYKRNKIIFYPLDSIDRIKRHWLLPVAVDVSSLLRAFVITMLVITVAYLMSFSENIQKSDRQLDYDYKSLMWANADYKYDVPNDTSFEKKFQQSQHINFKCLKCYYKNTKIFFQSFFQVVLSTFHMGIAPGILPITDELDKANSIRWPTYIVLITHYALSYLFLGIWIALLFKKISRN